MKITNIVIAAIATIPASCLAFAPSTSMTGTSSTVGRRTHDDVNKKYSTIDTTRTRIFMADNDDWEAPKSAMIGGAGVNNAGEPPFEIRGFSLGNLVILGGIAITVLSFAEYLSDSGSEGLNVSGLGFVYGIPVFLAGAALKYAEIEPVPCYTTPQGEAIFEGKATDIIKKVKQDVTRHRYGDEAHLDTTVKRLGLVVPGKAYPQLRELRQEEEGGELAFTMVWQSLDTPYKMWADEKRRVKYETFFGPGVGAEVVKIDAEQRLVGIKLTTGGPKMIESESAAAATTSESSETTV
mmetsp:Transcript_9855/g.14692  ORF Transcript_9855/g.14692 Transcript_9855/m.14692 type:complete len:295 (-) Transcript_9855:118-1002(-)|eukprot:CAMPEP_0203643120 /NCGR_PEP_ID=MMETSP0088-20131115/8554_1 /ASSEMBLY_ACC=CAM_ASM_001087 /TAXON_ID=426623 /ORGANISM="Chaetoceros affinis, Strain CCMP159" /LENGTH=294 /DNA_ID=CAMNT_0050499207 /DNA_START=140 /DNA_END=1024 /DNA_ORIENTATION=-